MTNLRDGEGDACRSRTGEGVVELTTLGLYWVRGRFPLGIDATSRKYRGFGVSCLSLKDLQCRSCMFPLGLM